MYCSNVLLITFCKRLHVASPSPCLLQASYSLHLLVINYVKASVEMSSYRPGSLPLDLHDWEREPSYGISRGGLARPPSIWERVPLRRATPARWNSKRCLQAALVYASTRDMECPSMKPPRITLGFTRFNQAARALKGVL